jgi:hypothetical protein
MYKAFACDPVVIDDGDEGLLRYCVSEVSEVGAREALERYLKDQRWKAFSIRQIRAATPGEVAQYKLPVGGIKLML